MHQCTIPQSRDKSAPTVSICLIRKYHLFRVLWIARRKDGAHFSPYPQINVCPAAIIERHDNELVTVIDKRGHLIPNRSDDLAKHLAAVADGSDRLLTTIKSATASLMGAICPKLARTSAISSAVNIEPS
jgi:hypothetical protein